jgi:hypothetical protein
LHEWLRLGIHVYTLLLLGLLLASGPWLQVTLPGATAEIAAKAGEMTNFGIRIGLWVTAAITLAEALIEVRGMRRKPAASTIPRTA